jgi:ferredoxin
MSLKAKYLRYLFFVLAILFALPLPLSKFTGLSLWISPYMFLISLFTLKSLVLFNLLGFLAMVFMFFKKRWICRYVCPLGVVCDWASKFQKNKDVMKLKLNKYLAIISIVLAIFMAPVLVVLDPFNIFHMAFEGTRTGFQFLAYLKMIPLGLIIVLNILLPNSWCRSLCPLGGMQLLAFDLGKVFRMSRAIKKPIIGNRRAFIAGITGILAGVSLPGLSIFSPGKRIRPPGALQDPDMNLVCARCGNCSGACPTRIIRPSGDTLEIGSLLTPVIDFSESYCLPECTLCGDVCPSGAIATFSKTAKKDLYMASVHIDLDRCWLQDQRDCDLCKFHCAYHAIEIRRTEESIIALPVLDDSKCVGCAACKIVCPPQAIIII